MPKFMVKGKTFHNPVEYAMHKIGGRWKMPILWRLNIDSPWRYGQLKQGIEGITHRVLSRQLKELEAAGLIRRKMYPVVPPKVEYSLTDVGLKMIPLIDQLRKVGMYFMKLDGIKQEIPPIRKPASRSRT